MKEHGKVQSNINVVAIVPCFVYAVYERQAARMVIAIERAFIIAFIQPLKSHFVANTNPISDIE